MLNSFSTMILAAGFGKRMLPLTLNLPKPLIKINGITLFDNTINFLQSLGCKQIVINTHYKHEHIAEAIRKNNFMKNIELIYENEILDTGGGIKNAISNFKNKSILVTNADIFWQNSNFNDVKNLINNFSSQDLCKLLLVEKKYAFGLKKNTGDFTMSNGKVRRYVDGDQIIYYSGMQMINLEVFNNIEENKFSLNTVWNSLIQKNLLMGQLMSSNWFHVGDTQGLNIFNKINS